MDSERLIEGATRQLATRAAAVLVRHPAIDANLPETSDLDFLAFTEASDLYPERLAGNGDGESSGRPIDVTWLPLAWLDDPRELAARGLIAHRLVTSDLVFSRTDEIAARCRLVTSAFHEPAVLEHRLAGFFQMGWLTVREVGITWDFPALALFWLHMAHAACLAAGLDALGCPCPNVYTRPLEYLPALEARLSRGLRAGLVRSLGLDRDPAQAMSAVRRVHARLSRRFPEPSWPAGMRDSTRFEYRYWLRPGELGWRVAAAEEMCRRGDAAAAVYYLRFYAYALARVPMVHARAREGCDVSYLRPERAVRPDLQRLCPEVIDDLSVVFAGTSSPTVEPVERALATVQDLRESVIGLLRSLGVPVPALLPWLPHERSERGKEKEMEAPCRT